MGTIFKHKTKRHPVVMQQVRRLFLPVSFSCQDHHTVHRNRSLASKVYTHPTSVLGRQHVGIKDTNIDLEPMQMRREHVTTTNWLRLQLIEQNQPGFHPRAAPTLCLQGLGAPQDAAVCRYAAHEPPSKGSSTKNGALVKEATPITLDRQQVNNF